MASILSFRALTVWFDVTSLYSWNRPVTGVTRMELECARIFLDSEPSPVRFVQLDSRTRCFVVCEPSGLSQRLAYLESLEGHPPGRLRPYLKRLLGMLPDRAQTSVLTALSFPRRLIQKLQGSFRPHSLSSGSDGVFQKGDCFVTVGFNLLAEQFNVLAEIRQRVDLRVVSCCHDLIPWVRPDLTLDRITRTFVRYLDDLVRVSDHVVCISECTAKDMNRFLEMNPTPPSTSVIRLGSRIGHMRVAPPSETISSILGRPFILYVSTIERRKNHEILLDAYRWLLNQGTSDLPMLVLVGMRGWGAERFCQKLDADPEVARYVTLLHHVSDHDLSHLYQKTLFTVYPSLYEGWGLPVAESLAYRKFCIASDAASVPEVGADLVRYCDPRDASAWGEAIFRFASHPEAIATEEEKIRQGYHPPEWHDTVRQIMQAVATSGQRI